METTTHLPRAAPRPEPAWRQAFLSYARWLDSISWKRFALLALLAFIAASILEELPPFNIPWGKDRTEVRDGKSAPGAPRREGAPIVLEGVQGSDGRRYDIRVDGQGVHVKPSPRSAASPPAADAARPNSSPGSAPAAASAPATGDPSAREIAGALSEAQEALADAGIIKLDNTKEVRIRAFRLGDLLQQAMLLAIVLSLGIKIMATGRFRAEAQAERAAEKAESESLKRHVVEARMAAMQAQVEPHFLFNTLASIDHLIETDPPRASQMQKHLIALLRATMPSLRDAAPGGPAALRDLGREVDIIRPYLEILKIRMEERLEASIAIPEGLLSAEFPPMMIQGLVENAIKHGLEPKAQGGRLDVGAQVVHGRLVVRVADTGVGFGQAHTAGSGVGLANLRERLALLYGREASLSIAENQPSGTVVTLTMPYRSVTPPSP